MAEADYYDILGVPLNADQNDIKNAYRAMSRRVHPDTGGNAALFRLVQQAYEILGDARRRAMYDQTRVQSNGKSSAPPEPPRYPEPEPPSPPRYEPPPPEPDPPPRWDYQDLWDERGIYQTDQPATMPAAPEFTPNHRKARPGRATSIWGRLVARFGRDRTWLMVVSAVWTLGVAGPITVGSYLNFPTFTFLYTATSIAFLIIACRNGIAAVPSELTWLFLACMGVLIWISMDVLRRYPFVAIWLVLYGLGIVIIPWLAHRGQPTRQS